MLKKPSSRAPSPTPTAFSGISNYRTTDSQRRDTKNAPPVPTIDYRLVSKTHFGELGKYLANYLAKAPPNSRSTARSKLTRLTIQQFHELSTDVYDELVRRQNEKEVPFLPVREDFHPKRNQARQKLATLPSSRFEDLSSDVYFELARRYPEFKEDPSGGRRSAGSTYDDYPAPDFGSGASLPRNNSRTSGRQSADRPSESGYGSAASGRRPSIDRRRPSETEFASGRRSDDAFRRPDDIYAGREESFSAALASRRKPSQDVSTRRSEDRERDRPDYGIGRRPSQATSNSDSTGTTNQPPQPSTTATSAMIIPNKSTMEEEYIDIPYGRDARDSGTVDGDRSAGLGVDDPPDSASEYASPLGTRSPPVGLSGLAARLKGVEDEDDTMLGNRSGDDVLDRYGRASVESRMVGGRTSAMTEDIEKIKSEYEYKIATMQSQISTLQRDLSNAREDEKRQQESDVRVRQLEEELAGLRQRAEEQTATMRSMQKELDDLRQARERELRQAEDDREELKIFQDRCNKLEEEFEMRQSSGNDADAIEQLQGDMQGLLTEVEELSRRNDELMNAKDADNMLIRDLDNQMKEYKRKYEQAKTELRSVKATSQLFLQAPKLAEDQLPVTADGGVLDIHVTSFLSAIDALLTAGRSSAPTRVLTPMKAVVNAVTNIIDDVKAYERRPQRDRPDLDAEAVRSLRERAEATLTNLVAASKTHASSSGMSPVSLLDAAASHVSATVTEIGRAIFIRKATKAEQEQASLGYTGTSGTNGFSPALRAVEERPGHQRKSSQASISSRGGRLTDSPRSYMRRPQSDNSRGSSGGMVSDDSAQAESSEDAWTELKPYLEAQTESIVYAIQAVLSGVRSPTPSPTLNENLTQIITIVSSIVAVCKDNLPQATSQQGNEILRELDEHANKLSEVQAMPEVTKESRQTMAKSSFAIANAMKGLMKL
ncbi:hypothetical protein CPB83DRAFT_766575 [Crepidotus variabilis]|uniref:GIT Spa2 homology (SHD) domain-containing protein n=1 Tax=Crepidotus variabilis TaxID=179855 RepID=A0A9P6EGH5_9AGAR|nr:hypothetical protein CPB83DRAFT_766575 [Crepidotus variabilis]